VAAVRKIVVFDDPKRVLDQQIQRDAKLSDFWEGLMWRLSRDPLNGAYRIKNSEPPTYVVRLHHWNVASLIVVYRFDAVEIHIVDLTVEQFVATVVSPTAPQPPSEL
jgi:hypothetical protein